MKLRLVLLLVLLFVGTSGAGVYFLHSQASLFVERKIAALIREHCVGCEFSAARTDLGLFPPRVILKDLTFRGGNRRWTEVRAQIQMLTVPYSPLTLREGRLKIGTVEILAPTVTVTEGDLPSPRSPDTKHSASKTTPQGLAFEISSIEIRDGTFTYNREHDGVEALIPLQSIQAKITSIGNTENLKTLVSEAQVEAVLAQSGKVDLKIGAQVFSETPHLDVDLKLKGQRLEDVNSYFQRYDGVKLQGTLIEGRGVVSIRNQTLKGSVWARYQDLEIDFEKNQERGALSAFFRNLVASLKVDPENVAERNWEQTEEAQLQRDPQESLIGFIFRGLKAAALKVATS